MKQALCVVGVATSVINLKFYAEMVVPTTEEIGFGTIRIVMHIAVTMPRVTIIAISLIAVIAKGRIVGMYESTASLTTVIALINAVVADVVTAYVSDVFHVYDVVAISACCCMIVETLLAVGVFTDESFLVGFNIIAATIACLMIACSMFMFHLSLTVVSFKAFDTK